MRAPFAPRALIAFAFPILCICIVFLSSLMGQDPGVPGQTVPPIKTDVSLVTLTATVLDKSGRTVTDLKKDDFLVYEDGSVQAASFFQAVDAPVSLGILFDTSGSMMDKMDEVQDAVIHLIDKTNPQDDIFVLQFSTEAFVVQDFTDDRTVLRQAIRGLQARGSTSLYEAIVKGLGHLQQGRYKKKALVVVTDGNDTSSQISLQEAVEFARGFEILIYCLGIGHGERGSFGHIEGVYKDTVDPDALLAFSDVTGGRTFLLEGSLHRGGTDQIDQACQQVVMELRRQYTLGYYPTNRRMDGSFRRIRVEVKSKNFQVRTREGYFATQAPANTLPQP